MEWALIHMLPLSWGALNVTWIHSHATASRTLRECKNLLLAFKLVPQVGSQSSDNGSGVHPGAKPVPTLVKCL